MYNTVMQLIVWAVAFLFV